MVSPADSLPTGMGRLARRSINSWRVGSPNARKARALLADIMVSYRLPLSCQPRPMLTRYRDSTFVRAQGVFRRNFSDDVTLGSCVKHRMSIVLPSVSQP